MACHKEAHDAAKDVSGEQNIAAIICSHCQTEQEVAEKCVKCHISLAKVSHFFGAKILQDHSVFQ